jgi:hypothetical protein
MHDIEVLSPLASAARCLTANTPLYDPIDFAVFQNAYDEACRALGLEPAARDIADGFAQVRNRVAAAVLDQARSGERDCAVLTSFAVAHGLRHWPLS